MQAYQKTYNILIADDHQLITDGISKILQEERMISAVYTASNGHEAIERVVKHDIDCVLMDLNMPVLSGYEATKIIKEKAPHVKVIVVSMLNDASVIAKLLKAGADAFIIKNTGKEELLRAIARVLNGEKYISQELSFNLYQHFGKKNAEEKQDHLTPRELEIIKYIGEGMTNHEIAAKLFLSPATVDTHRKNVLAKLELKNTAALVRYAAENNLL
ncbi:MAG TPA: response regulator transcription factor [Chitinophagaceae bacterium]|nr:response regulator transcription factor [Chitinophagaceae bacterium]